MRFRIEAIDQQTNEQVSWEVESPNVSEARGRAFQAGYRKCKIVPVSDGTQVTNSTESARKSKVASESDAHVPSGFRKISLAETLTTPVDQLSMSENKKALLGCAGLLVIVMFGWRTCAILLHEDRPQLSSELHGTTPTEPPNSSPTTPNGTHTNQDDAVMRELYRQNGLDPDDASRDMESARRNLEKFLKDKPN